MKVISIDLGGTHATCAVVEDARIISASRLQFSDTKTLQPLLPELTHTLHVVLSENNCQTSDITGIALGFCGLVDSRSNRVLSTNGKYNDILQLDMSAWAQREFGIPLRLENDARMSLLGECYAGGAQGETDVFMFTLGTGIGGVSMMDGHLLHGKHGQAGVLGGHVPINFNGRFCSCGAIGCAEAEAAGWSLPLICEAWPLFKSSALSLKELNFQNLFACAAEGDVIALDIRSRCLAVWAAAAVSAIHSFDPDLLLFGGGIMHNGDIILPYIQDYVDKHAWTPWGRVRLAAAQLGNNAGLLGAVPLLRGQFADAGR